VALAALAAEVVASATPSAQARGLSIALAADAATGSVDGDAFLLQRAIANLIENALDFSPAGGTVTVAVEAHARSLDVVVRDQGPGIPEYAGDKVFEKFYSLARPSTRKKSTGLGLAFVKEIAELHRGRATLKNGEPRGAVARLSLPLGGS